MSSESRCRVAVHPVGAICLRRDKMGLYRAIKVRSDGPQGRRWMHLGAYLYQQAHGPVPEGMRVIHLDGDRLNCDLANLRAVTPSDALYLAGERKGKRWLDAALHRAHAACSKANRARMIGNRLLGVIQPSLWYGIDHNARVVYGPLGRNIKQALACFGCRRVEAETFNSRRSWLSLQLGWSELPTMNALVLAALVDGPLPTYELPDRLEQIAARLGHSVRYSETSLVTNAIPELTKAGYVTSRRSAGEGPHKVRAITDLALQARGKQYPVAPMRGKDARRYIDEEGYHLEANMASFSKNGPVEIVDLTGKLPPVDEKHPEHT